MGNIDYDGFSAYLARHDRRNTTIARHVRTLRFLERHLPTLEKTQAEKFLVELKKQGKSGAYLNSFVFTLRLYGEYKGLDLKIQEFARHPKPKATLSDDEIEAFLNLPRRSHQPVKYYLRLKMFWALIAFTGMRPGECAVLKPVHFDFGRGVIIIENSKTNTPGQVPIPANLVEDIKEYIKNIPANDYLFPSARGGDSYQCGLPVLDNVAWHYDWTQRIKQLNLKRPNLTPYSFRHSYATRLLEEDVSLFHVKKLMRHNDLKSTLVYEHLTTKDLIKAQQKLPLIRKSTNPKQVLQSLSDVVKGFHLENDQRFRYQLIEDGTSIRFECNILDEE